MILSIDIGGTAVKMGLVDREGTIHARHEASVCYDNYQTPILTTVIREAKDFLARENAAIEGIGVSATGQVDDRMGAVIGTNGKIPHYEGSQIKLEMEKTFGVPAFALNDANAAALGECFAGRAKGAENMLMITLGTGVGGGVILDGQVYAGFNFAGAELGHTVIEKDGRPCSCGRRGCWEAYSSATGLIAMTKEKVLYCRENGIHTLMEKLICGDLSRISGKTAFTAAKEGDKAGREVVDMYIDYLACGIANMINIFQPQVLSIGGGICHEGDYLLLPLKERVFKEVYTRSREPATQIKIAQLGNDAGIIGAASLGR